MVVTFLLGFVAARRHDFGSKAALPLIQENEIGLDYSYLEFLGAKQGHCAKEHPLRKPP
jgi:hypothetical protein